MKKIITLSLIMFAALSTRAQLSNTKWKGILKIDEDLPTLFSFGKDTLKLTRFANGVGIENMSYTVTDSTLTLKKTNGQSDCDNDVIGKYKFSITGDKLSIKLIADACYDRSSVLDNTSFTKFEWPAIVPVDPVVLKQYTGVYAMDDQHLITITVENGKLIANSKTNLAGKTELYAASDTKFLFHLGDISLDFIKSTAGSIAKFIVHENGKDYDWKKVK